MNQNISNNLRLAASLKESFGIKNLPESINHTIGKLKNSEIPPIIYIKGKTCAGCSVSLINFTNQSTTKLIVNHESIYTEHCDNSLFNLAVDLISRYISGNLGPYFFAMDGFIPHKNPISCYMANRPLTDWVKRAGKTCLAAISFGNCATSGNPSVKTRKNDEHIGVDEYFRKESINKPVVNISGCPINPDSLWTLIVDLVKAESIEIPIHEMKKYTLKTA